MVIQYLTPCKVFIKNKNCSKQAIIFLCCCCCGCITSVVSNSVRTHRRQPTRLPRPWDSPGKNTGVGCHFLLQCMKGKSESEVTQSCTTLSDPMDWSPPGSSIHGIFQARVLEWGAITFSEYSCQSKQFYQTRCLDTVAYNKYLSNEYQNIPLTVHGTFVPIKMVENQTPTLSS